MKKLIKLLVVMFLMTFSMAFKPVTTKAIEAPESISVQGYVRSLGWTDWNNYGSAGYAGRNLPLEGIKLKLSSDLVAKGQHIKYRVHVQDIGWMDWVQDGQVAGAPERNLPIEAIQIKIVDNYGAKKMPFTISYKAHISNIGWEEKYVKDGETAGTVGKALPIEAIIIDFNFPKLNY